MDLSLVNASPVLADPAPVNQSTLGFYSTVFTRPVPKKKPSKLDDVWFNGWLDAMQSSSPPRKRMLKDAACDDNDLVYYSWMLKYPSALKWFDRIINRANKKKIVIFLDYDGTLSPIVDDPNRAFMSKDMRSAVKGVAKYCPTAIISGRSRDKVYELVGLTELLNFFLE